MKYLFYQLVGFCQEMIPIKANRLRLKEKFMHLDSALIVVCMAFFFLARFQRQRMAVMRTESIAFD
jgi:hypothetical protein